MTSFPNKNVTTRCIYESHIAHRFSSVWHLCPPPSTSAPTWHTLNLAPMPSPHRQTHTAAALRPMTPCDSKFLLQLLNHGVALIQALIYTDWQLHTEQRPYQFQVSFAILVQVNPPAISQIYKRCRQLPMGRPLSLRPKGPSKCQQSRLGCSLVAPCNCCSLKSTLLPFCYQQWNHAKFGINNFTENEGNSYLQKTQLQNRVAAATTSRFQFLTLVDQQSLTWSCLKL